MRHSELKQMQCGYTTSFKVEMDLRTSYVEIRGRIEVALLCGTAM